MAIIYDINSYRRLNGAAIKQELDISGYVHQQKFMGKIPAGSHQYNTNIEQVIEDSFMKEQRKKLLVVGTMILSIATFIGVLEYYYGSNYNSKSSHTVDRQGVDDSNIKKTKLEGMGK